MTDAQTAWLLAIAGGGAAGVLYFAGLWWTVRRASRASHPVLIIAGSFLLRGIVAAALIVFLAGGDPWRLLASMGAFLVARTVAVRLARATPSSTSGSRENASEPRRARARVGESEGR